jgi:antagonist of KipI
MRAIQAQAPGLFTTVQDLGREGFGPLGVSASGAADAIALRLGNRLVGNAEGAAGLEMTLIGGEFFFADGAAVALAGSDFGAALDGAPVLMWRSFEVRAGQTLRLGPTRSGARCYLCVAGGIEVEPFLGSASTHVLSGLGGLGGRALRKGDVVHIGDSADAFRTRMAAPDAVGRLAPRKLLRVTAGLQSDCFSEAARAALYSGPYRVTEESNRMGLRLEGPPIAAPAGHMITEGAPLGAIQAPPGGQPIILFVEQQTTGGYLKIANVIAADLPSVGQLRPRDEIRFELVSFETARALLREQEALLRSEGLILG